MSGLLKSKEDRTGCPFMDEDRNMGNEYYWCNLKQEWIVDGETEQEYFMKFCYGKDGYRACPAIINIKNVGIAIVK